MRIGEQKWHRSCLQCMQCKKSLQFETCNDQHGVPLCSACAEPYLPPAAHHAYTTRHMHTTCKLISVLKTGRRAFTAPAAASPSTERSLWP